VSSNPEIPAPMMMTCKSFRLSSALVDMIMVKDTKIRERMFLFGYAESCQARKWKFEFSFYNTTCQDSSNPGYRAASSSKAK
jgi:hypothetical protein